jgi:hypothetical protein
MAVVLDFQIDKGRGRIEERKSAVLRWVSAIPAMVAGEICSSSFFSRRRA